MFKKVAFTAVGLSLLAAPLLASADTASDIRTQIDGLLEQLKSLQSQLIGLQNGQTQTTPAIWRSAPDTPADFPCLKLERALMYGAQGDDVAQLQQYLKQQGIFGGDATGFFGTLTQAAIQRLQSDNGIVNSGDPATTGWGVVGPGTRAWFYKRCGGINQNFSASPTSGAAPLTVSFSTSGITSANPTKDYSVDFGDGVSAPISVVGQRECFAAPCESNIVGANHTYTANGTYTAKLIYQPSFSCPPGAMCPAMMPAPQTIGTVTITVGPVGTVISCPMYSMAACPAGQHMVSDGPQYDERKCPVPNSHCVPDAPAGAPNVSGVDGPASLAIGQQGTWTVHASVASGGNTSLRYSVVWGDEGVFDQLRAIAGGMAPSSLQASGSFTHAYQNAGTYRPTFTVANDMGSSQASASVAVGGDIGVIGGPVCRQYQLTACPAGQHRGSGSFDQNKCPVPGDCVPDTTNTDTFSATPTSGATPLAVIFRTNIVNNLDTYSINFGDGTSGTWQDNCRLGYGACGMATVYHTYNSGTYIATLIQTSSCPFVGEAPCYQDQRPYQRTLGTVTITVGDGGRNCNTSDGCLFAPGQTTAPTCPAGTTLQQNCTSQTCKLFVGSDWGNACETVAPVCTWSCVQVRPLSGSGVVSESSDVNANLANALSAIESALKALIANLGQ